MFCIKTKKKETSFDKKYGHPTVEFGPQICEIDQTYNNIF